MPLGGNAAAAMQFESRGVRVLGDSAAEGGGGGSAAVPSVSLYAEPPAGEVTLEDFEVFALNRLKGARRLRVCGRVARDCMYACMRSRARRVRKCACDCVAVCV